MNIDSYSYCSLGASTIHNFAEGCILDELKLFIFSNGKSFFWPCVQDDKISFKSMTAGVSDHLSISTLYGLVSSSAEAYIYAGCTPIPSMPERRSHLMVYKVEIVLESLKSITHLQDFVLCYRPLRMLSLKYDNSIFLIVSGCDKDFHHFYEVEPSCGTITRNSSKKDRFKIFWSSIYGTVTSPHISMCFESEQTNDCCQVAIGCADGQIICSRYIFLSLPDTTQPDLIPIESIAPSNKAPMNSCFTFSLLFESVIICMKYYNLKNKFKNHLNGSFFEYFSTHLLIGLSSGLVAIVNLKEPLSHSYLLPDMTMNGSVFALAVGDMSMSTSCDIVSTTTNNNNKLLLLKNVYIYLYGLILLFFSFRI